MSSNDENYCPGYATSCSESDVLISYALPSVVGDSNSISKSKRKDHARKLHGRKRKRCFQRRLYCSVSSFTCRQRTSLPDPTPQSSRSLLKISPTFQNAQTLQTEENQTQLFDIRYLTKQLRDVHLCPNGRLAFLANTQTSFRLFHPNAVRCSKCKKQTIITNFPPNGLIENSIQVPNQQLYLASAVTGIGYDSLSLIMSSLSLSITSKQKFLP
ncbi:unnamed protein product [Didymodactylos carnosus]|uniref:Uncharacterized protein n=1 Tax=Didymodactylos carnosus TaxID=1234261 RepID=A0A8S2TXW5_9BILA|nr:unnamed protein product [Didymodactylos carnosus]